jgi:transcription initiation factor TFIID subunit 6
MIPVLLSTVVGKQLCTDPGREDHWALRRYSAKLLANILDRYSEQYPTLLPRVTKTLLVALVDDAKPISTKYGAVVALSLLGVEVCRLCLVPNAKKYATDIFEPMLVTNDAGGNINASNMSDADNDRSSSMAGSVPQPNKYVEADVKELLKAYAVRFIPFLTMFWISFVSY